MDCAACPPADCLLLTGDGTETTAVAAPPMEPSGMPWDGWGPKGEEVLAESSDSKGSDHRHG